MRYSLILLVFFSLFITNCSKTYYVKYDAEKPDMVTTNDLKAYLNQTENPNIVLRVPNAEDNPTQENSSNYFRSVYNTIEKELLRSGFNVRDRALFNEIISRTGQKSNYSDLQSQTDTDIILELVNIGTKVKFTTNSYYESKSFDKKKTLPNDESLTAYGAKVEFKVILIKENQFAGSYLFYYEPCVDGCPIKINDNTRQARFINEQVKEEENEGQVKEDPFQYVSKSAFENFIKNATQELINEMRSSK